MDDLTHGTKPRISAAEMHRRREVILQAEANTRLAGQSCSPEAEAIFESFVRSAKHGQTF